MKIIIVHGDNTSESYERIVTFLKSAKKRGFEIFRVNTLSQNLPEILSSETLFQKEKLVVVENINLINQSTLKWLKRKEDDLNTNLVIYHQGTIPVSFFKKLPKVEKTEEYKLPKIIWTFLESFYPGNQKTILHLLHKLVKKEPIEFVFILLVRQLRDLYWVKKDPKTLAYPSWRVAKLTTISRRFTDVLLEEILSAFADADIKTKTSKSGLLDELDFIIASKLE